ncbi:hypothetical protein EDC22_11329 [Tepidamorphus gemmatus]|jgi:hypothetical protein|uniref:Uncharacterized protein n=1 Tax=Tepidamorphus gemmatus TaxID=747076 RepID=A0A4R3M2F3_9HYPH|nr:hypothetical protein EDC22_11329 [Tepidamorphus gemmatus]
MIAHGGRLTIGASAVVGAGRCRPGGRPLTFRNPDSGRVNVSIGSIDQPAHVRPRVRMPTAMRMSRRPEQRDWCEPTSEAAAGHGGDQDAIAALVRTSNPRPHHERAKWPTRNEPR